MKAPENIRRASSRIVPFFDVYHELHPTLDPTRILHKEA
jgi:hypothetical protein